MKKINIELQVVKSVLTGNVFVYNAELPCSKADQALHGWIEIGRGTFEVDVISDEDAATKLAELRAAVKEHKGKVADIDDQIKSLKLERTNALEELEVTA